MLSESGINERNVNPLATRYVAPGRLPWIGSGDTGLDSMVERFERLGRCCQIIGPHGSGKSTLLEHLVPRLGSNIVRIDVNGVVLSSPHNETELTSQNPQAVWWFTLRRGSAVMNRLSEFWKQKEFSGLLVLDGGEQLSWWWRRRLVSWVRRRRCSLIVTSHSNLGLKTLVQTSVTPQLAKEVVRQAFSMARGETVLPAKIEEIDWESWLRQRQGNLRECLMDLYDQVEIIMREAK